jgi:hypothetical protein
MGLEHQFNRIDGLGIRGANLGLGGGIAALERNSMLRLADEAVAETAVVTADAGAQFSWGKFAVLAKLGAGSRSACPLAMAGLRRAAAEKDHEDEADQESHAAILERLSMKRLGGLSSELNQQPCRRSPLAKVQ